MLRKLDKGFAIGINEIRSFTEKNLFFSRANHNEQRSLQKSAKVQLIFLTINSPCAVYWLTLARPFPLSKF